MSKSKRKKLYVDRQVQGVIVRRVLLYCGCSLLFMILPILIVRVIVNPDRFFFENFGAIWIQYWPVLLILLFFVVFAPFDLVRLTNRFAGPVFRLRREMERLANGEKVKPVHFREGDYWQDFAESFNKIVERLDAFATDDRAMEREPIDEEVLVAAADTE
ncbi:MAG: hypothetical protein IH991_25080 [Planctomycetes bacterium]|nr:hypothetical protein [Planctomycetota bacterium]